MLIRWFELCKKKKKLKFKVSY